MKNYLDWQAFEIKSWKTIPVISGRIATEKETKNKTAVFCLQHSDPEHKAFKMDLPKLAYLTNQENGERELIVVIQAETTNLGTVIGYRNPKGGNGACLFCELEFLSDQEIQRLTE